MYVPATIDVALTTLILDLLSTYYPYVFTQHTQHCAFIYYVLKYLVLGSITSSLNLFSPTMTTYILRCSYDGTDGQIPNHVLQVTTRVPGTGYQVPVNKNCKPPL